jgi:DNA-binding CsgD family transcriptional regulator
VVPATTIRRRVRDDLVRLVHRDLGIDDFARQAGTLLRRAVPGDGTCLLLFDPATLLPTGEIVDNGLSPAVTPRLTEIELREPDVNKFTELARRARPAASLSAATQGHLDQSLRQRELRAPSGFGDELRAVLVDGSSAWAALTVLRVRGRPDFTAAEVRFVASVSGVLADGVRRALLSSAPAVAAPGDAGVVVLAPDGTLELADEAGDRWLDELGADRGDGLPTAVTAVADRARRGRDAGRPALARARVRTAAGGWVTVRGSALGDGPDARVAVHLEGAHPPELAPLLVAAFGLTARERRVTELVAQGHSTRAVAARLGVSAYTVQDHLRSIFDKSGTASRSELVARLFVGSHAPSLDTTPPAGLPAEDGPPGGREQR